MRLLLSRDVDIKSKDAQERTAVSLAAENGHQGVVRLLLSRDDVEADSNDSLVCPQSIIDFSTFDSNFPLKSLARQSF